MVDDWMAVLILWVYSFTVPMDRLRPFNLPVILLQRVNMCRGMRGRRVLGGMVWIEWGEGEGVERGEMNGGKNDGESVNREGKGGRVVGRRNGWMGVEIARREVVSGIKKVCK